MSVPARPPCASPIEPDVLLDYWRTGLDASQEEAIELHLFGCDACGDRLRQLIALAEGLRDLARSGELRVVVGDRFVQQATGLGGRVRAYVASPGDTVQCTVSPDDDYLVARLGADLSSTQRVDLSFSTPQGAELHRLADIPVNEETGTVVYQESIGFAKTAPSNSMVMRLLAVDAAGGERLLGEYTFNHTRTIPGPPGWEL